MAVLALGLAGSWAGGALLGGATFLGMSGAQLGWTVGSMLGNMLQKGPTIEGPRLSDLKVTTTGYGSGIPVVWGSVRLAGNVIWSTDLIETRSESTQGGKGGPPKATQVSYSYRVSLAMGLCESEIAGVRRLWANNELLFNAGSGTATSIMASELNAQSITVYLGTEDQLPDPTIESYVGVDNTPAYRGIAYIVFQDLQLEKFGNRLPNIECEVVQFGTEDSFRALGNVEIVQPSAGYAAPPYQVETNGGLYAYYSISSIEQTYNYGAPMAWALEGNAVRVLCADLKNRRYDGLASPGSTGVTYAVDKVRNNFYSYLLDIETGEVLERTPYENYWPSNYGVWYEPEDGSIGYSDVPAGTWVGGSNPTIPFQSIYYRTKSTTVIGGLDLRDRTGFGSGVILDDSCVLIKAPYSAATNINLCKWLESAGYTNKHLASFVTSADRKSLFVWLGDFAFNDDTTTDRTLSSPDTCLELELDETGQPVIVRTITFKSDAGTQDTRALFKSFGMSAGKNDLSHVAVESNKSNIWLRYDNTLYILKINSANKIELLSSLPLELPTLPPNADHSSFVSLYADAGVCVGVSRFYIFKFTRVASLSRQAIKLYEIIDDLCARSGLDSSDWDSSELLQDVDGYVVANPMSARAAMEPLQMAYFFDGVESDYKIKFRNRGRAPVATIEEDQLAAMENYDTELPDQLNRTRIQELELPKKLSVNYLSLNGDYQQSTQHDQRIITRAVNEVSVDMPIVLSDDKALSVVRANLYAAWEQRETYTFATSRKYALLDPTDVVLVNKGPIQFRMRITKRTEGGNGIVQWEGVREDSGATYVQTGTGANIQTGQQDVKLPAITTLKFIDTVSLRTSDMSSPMVYIAAGGYGENWDGGLLYKSLDNGGNYVETGDILKSRAICGTVDLPFGAPDQYGIFDEKTVITINLNSESDELTSATYAQVLAGANACYIGGEIIQFRTATQVASRQWQISGLLRGRLGTEKYASKHLGGDDFVLLNSRTLYTETFTASNINQQIYLKAPSFGQTLGQAVGRPFTYKANNMRPLSPVYVKGGQDAEGNWGVEWIRRSRNGKEWSDAVDAPLEETTEQYVIEIYDTLFSVKKGQYTSTTQSFNYTLAQQTADFGAVQTRFGVKIYQVSSVVGVGDGAQVLLQVGSSIINDANAAYIDTLLLMKPHSIFTFQERAGTNLYNRNRTGVNIGSYNGTPELNVADGERRCANFGVGAADYGDISGTIGQTVNFATGITVVHAHKALNLVDNSEFFSYGETPGGIRNRLAIARNASNNTYEFISYSNNAASSTVETSTTKLQLNSFDVVAFTIDAGTIGTLANVSAYVDNTSLTLSDSKIYLPRFATRTACYVNRSQDGSIYAKAKNAGTAIYKRVLNSTELTKIQSSFDTGTRPSAYRARLSNFGPADMLNKNIEADSGVTADNTENMGVCLAFDGTAGGGVFYSSNADFDMGSDEFSINFAFKTGSDTTSFQVLCDLGDNISRISQTSTCSREDGCIVYIVDDLLWVGTAYNSGYSLSSNTAQTGATLVPETWYRVYVGRKGADVDGVTSVSRTFCSVVIDETSQSVAAIGPSNGRTIATTGGTTNLAIGNFNSTAGQDAPFNGKIQDFRYIVGDYFADPQ